MAGQHNDAESIGTLDASTAPEASSPIHQLPVEILSDIFALSQHALLEQSPPIPSSNIYALSPPSRVPNLKNGTTKLNVRSHPYDWLSITEVCRHWHAVATTQSPQLWSDIRIPTIWSSSFLRLSLTRASGAPLSITLHSDAGTKGIAYEMQAVRLLLTALAELQRVWKLSISLTQ